MPEAEFAYPRPSQPPGSARWHPLDRGGVCSAVVTVELTPAQARVVAELAEREGVVSLHQLSGDEKTEGDADVFATPHGAEHGYCIHADGRLVDIGKTLPGH